MERAFEDRGRGELVEHIAEVCFFGEGASYRVYLAGCRVPGPEGDDEGRLVVRLPRSGSSPELTESARREARLLSVLSERGFPLQLPRPFALVPVDSGLAVVQHQVFGLRIDHASSSRPIWELIAEAAAQCHKVDLALVADGLPGPRTRREHALEEIAILERLELKEALGWARDHLPPDDPARLLHGDLLPQNLLYGLSGEGLGLIDWERAQLGDPAYDLSIVTRGKRRPFREDKGLEKLLEAYKDRSAVPLRAWEVQVYELGLLAGFYETALEEEPRNTTRHQHQRDLIAGLLKRARLADRA